MKQIYFSLLFMVITFSTFAQDAQVSGIIRDESTKYPIEGAAVRFEKKRGAISDASGQYRISLPAGQYTLIYSVINYKKVTKEITVKDGERLTVDVEMKTDAFQLNEVTTVSKYGKNSAKETVSIDVVGKDQIKHTNSNDLGEAINKTSGVLVQDGQISIRGGSSYSYGIGSRTAVMVDGSGLMSADLGESQNKMVPLGNVKQIEVVKGASSVIYGSSALNGVINVVTEWPKGSEPKTDISVNTGVYDKPSPRYLKWWQAGPPHFTNVDFNHQRKIGNVQVIIGGNLTTNKSYLQGGDEFRTQLYFKTRYLSPKVEGLAFGLNGTVMYEASDRFFISKDLDSNILSQAKNSEDRYTRSTIDPHLTYTSIKGHKYTMNFRYINIFRTGNGTDPNAVSHSFSMDNQYQYKLKKYFVLTAGIPLNFGTSTSNLYSNRRRTYSGAAYAQVEANYKVLSWQGGLRYEVSGVDTNFEKGKPIFRTGLNIQAAKATFFRLSWGQGYRIPSVGEKYVAQQFFSNFVVVPNDTLKSETSWNLEFGIKQGFKIGNNWKAFVDVAFYWQEYKNYIEYGIGVYPNLNRDGTKIFKDSTLEFPSTGSGYLLGIKGTNVDNARIFGYEATIGGAGKIGPVGVQLGIGYNYSYPIKKDSLGNYPSIGKFLSDAFKYNTKRVTGSDLNNVQYYRIRNLVKGDIEISYWKMYLGATFFYGTLPENIPALFLTAVALIDGSATNPNKPSTFPIYLSRHQKGDFAMDLRAGFKLNDKVSFGFIVKNVMNRIYQLRPGKVEPIRNFTAQFRYTF